MTGLNQQMLSSDRRFVGLRTRRDLVITESEYQDEYCWIVKDPLAMKYFRLRKPEYLTLQLLSEPISYHQLKQTLSRAFPASKYQLSTVQQLVISLHRNGLLVSSCGGQAIPLRKRRTKERNRKLLGLMSSLVSLRFPGWDPEAFLNWLYPKTRFLFSSWFTSLVLTTCFAALALVLSNFQSFLARLPEFQQFFKFENLLFMGGILIFTKSIHELGHGLFCKHFGGECHQIGFMLLVLTPAMYCDTSDSWTLKSRWRRMAIGAAGMYVELFMAACCTFIWWLTHPGWIHYLALNIMFLSSVSTVVFNANPLLRYDGYYILSDFLEIPNLAQRATQSLTSKLREWCLGIKPLNSRLLPEKNRTVFAIYSVASFLYRWFVMIAIFWFISKIFEPYGLEAIGHLMIALSLVGMVGVPLYKSIKYFAYPGRFREVKKLRLYTTLTLFLAVLAFVCFVPLPHYVWASFIVRPQNGDNLILTQAGKIQDIHVSEGQFVNAGDAVVTLKNSELQIELEQFKGQLARLQADLTGYLLISDVHLDLASKISGTEVQIKSVQQQIQVKQQQLEQLKVRAGRAGVLFAPRNISPRPHSEAATRFSSWTGTPLSPENQNAYFEANTMIATVGDPNKMEAVLVVDQSDIQLLKAGQKVICLSEQFRTDFLETELAYVSADEMSSVPRELSQTFGGPIAVKPATNGEEQPLLKSYEARASFAADQLAISNIKLLPGMRGHAKIRVGNSSLGHRLLRYLGTIIKFR